MTMREYLTPTGVPLVCLPGARSDDAEWDEPVPYVPDDDVELERPLDDAELEQRLARAVETARVWQEVARQLQARCERMITDLSTHTGRTRSAVRAHYVPEVTGGHLEPI